MKDEIKEILDRLERIDHKEYSSGFEFADSGSFYEDCRCFEERKKLANYITNLQDKVEWYENIEINKTIDKFRLEHNKEYQRLSKEIDRLNNIISETSKDIQHELSHLKANDEETWNEEFYTNDKLDYRKLCIALLEQFINKLKEKE